MRVDVSHAGYAVGQFVAPDMQTLSEAAQKILDKSAQEMSEKQRKAFMLGASWVVYKIRAECKAEMIIEPGAESGPLVFKVKSEWLESILK